MLLLRTSRTALEAHCYVVAAGRGHPAVVVDPGAGAADGVAALVREHDLTVGAVVLTHGHADHVWDAATVADGAPVHVGAPDRYRLEDPAAALGPLADYFRALAGTPWQSPADVRPFPAGSLSEGGAELVPGVVVRAVPAPGHTEGSTVLLVRGPLDTEAAGADVLPPGAPRDDDGGVLVAFCGDVLFAGSMGRTDLPGGDDKEMASTLRTLGRALPPDTVLLPGHGPATVLATELRTNPYLRRALG